MWCSDCLGFVVLMFLLVLAGFSLRFGAALFWCFCDFGVLLSSDTCLYGLTGSILAGCLWVLLDVFILLVLWFP